MCQRHFGEGGRRWVEIVMFGSWTKLVFIHPGCTVQDVLNNDVPIGRCRVEAGKLLIKDYMELRSNVGCGWVINEGNISVVLWRVSNVDALPATALPFVRRAWIVLEAFV